MGDIPTPTKERIGSSIVQNAMEKAYFDPGSSYANKVVKWADQVEALHFLHENGMGRHAQRVRTRLTLNLLEGLDKEPEEEIREAVKSVLSDIQQGDFVI